ncbi:phenylalanine--tRNA ligase subunit beta [Paenibacillus thermotolerans]|uniref:phenylalanine--tRNA ligase subunit beta n=1 Tax=Paenibacillus thermotolerans TaxID=3027807 RepID=UPI00236822D2|nr:MULTISPECIES: phenylalanine--tRNA ligase subunit beta [unclassified Paenibacillus]
MKVSYKWLSEYVDVGNVSGKELAELLTRGGVEVDGVESRNKGVDKVVVGYVVSREKHPDADKLNVCQVDVGTGELLQIVCGAKNVDAGQKVPVALVGASLPGDVHIKRAKLRGVESQGMICSARELGLNDKLLPKEIQEGILVLPENAELGADILQVLGIDDEVLELDLTPNRSDCLSMIGVAYEVGALIGCSVTLPDAAKGLTVTDKTASDLTRIEIEAKEDCSYFGARMIEHVQIGPSPLWIQNRLMAAGIRPINNVVDITNFVMLEYGQPLHAYDADTLAGGGKQIVVRLAREGEKLETLDGNVRDLQPHMLLITDGEQPVGLAGVMGGAKTEVSSSTTRILLESARFSGLTVRRTSRELGLRSEASLRFEKEVNPEAVVPALDRATALICRYAGGLAAEGRAEASVGKQEPRKITITLSRINEYLGTELSSLEVKAILARLAFGLEGSGETITVTVPTRRGDIARDVDLIEEIARLYGYDNIPTTLIVGNTTPGSLTRRQKLAREVRKVLSQSGLHEAVTYSLTTPERLKELPGLFGNRAAVRLAMPMSEERSVLRACLLPNLAESAVHNRNRNVEDVALFEIGSVFISDEEKLTTLPEERVTVAALMTGAVSDPHWSGKSRTVDFYDLKGILEKLLLRLGIGQPVFEQAAPAGFHPGRTAEVFAASEHARVKLGRIGQLHPELQKLWELDDTYVFELDFAALVEAANEAGTYDPLPRFPASARDIAVVVDSGVPAGALMDTIRSSAGDYLESVRVFDVYTGERLGAGKKSVAISLVYRHADRTLTDDEVAEAHGRVTEALAERHGAELRK